MRDEPKNLFGKKSLTRKNQNQTFFTVPAAILKLTTIHTIIALQTGYYQVVKRICQYLTARFHNILLDF